MLGKTKGKELIEYLSDYVIFDLKTTGISCYTDKVVADAPLFNTILKDFLAFAGDLPLAGHNIASFDMNFIYRDSEKFYGMVPGNDYVDTLRLAWICLPELKHHTLTDLAAYYGISTEGAHRALNDCRMNRAVFEKLGEILPEKLKSTIKCPRCGNILVKRHGRFGAFMGCIGYPGCSYTEDIKS